MEPQGRNRPFLPKVKSGCLTCKTRKVKCDESKPQCRRCTSSGRTCSGYPQPASASSLGQQVDHSMAAWLGSDVEKRSFDFFLTRAGQRLGGFFHTPFWSREVLQAAIRHPSIRHLVVALGAAYEQFERREPHRLSDGSDTNSNNEDDDGMRFALQQCNRAIRHIADLAGSAPQSSDAMCCVLTASVLFAIFASLQAHFAQAIGHVRSGIRVLHNLAALGPATAAFPVPLARLRSLLTGLYAQTRAMINDEARAPLWHGSDPLVSPLAPAHVFLHLADAQAYVEALYTNTLAFFQRTELRPPATAAQADAVVAERERLCAALRSSRAALEAFVERGGAAGAGTADGSEGRAVAVLRVYHLLLVVQLGVHNFEGRRESLFDDAEQLLVQMLEQCRLVLQDDDDESMSDGSQDGTARQPVYSSGLGAVMPLHMIAARCRNPAVRQEAVALLHRARRREWLWDSTLAEKIVSTTIEFEQRACLEDGGQQADVQGVQRVPDDARIREVKLHFEGDRGARIDFITVGQWKNKQSGYQRFIEW